VGQIFDTKSGKYKAWITREEENRKTIDMSATRNKRVVLFAVFELPVASKGIELRIE
jgi:hypothetical protein